MNTPSSSPRILFVYAKPFDETSFDGSAPRERHGFFALRERDVDVAAVDNRLRSSAVSFAVAELFQRAYVMPRTGLGYRFDQAAAVRRYVAHDAARWVLAGTDSIALPLLSLKRRGRLANPVAYRSVGLGDRLASGRISGRRGRRYAQLLELANVVYVYTPAEADILAARAPGSTVRVIPLGVDVDWWTPPPDRHPEPATVFSTGRDPSRSFPTLAAAVKPLPVRTTIVGTLAREQGVEASERLTLHPDLPVAELRALLWRSAIVAVPSLPTAHGGGQTAALHAMAAGKPVVLSDSGWARHFGLRPRAHFLDVPAGNVDALRAAIESLVDDPVLARGLGAAAREVVRARFTTAHEAAAILAGLGPT